MRRSLWIHPLIVVALLRISISCIADEEFICEEAVSHMTDCCPGVQDRVDCTREFRTCNGFQCDPHYTKTELSPRAARCVLDKNCGELQGTCTAVTSSEAAARSIEAIQAEACR